MATAAFILAALALSLIVAGWARNAWARQDAARWSAGVRKALAGMTPEQRREWRMWWLRDAFAAEEWLRQRTKEAIP